MTEQKGTRGGARPGAGNPNFRPKWNAGETKTIRVPEALADDVMVYARKMDEQYPNHKPETIDKNVVTLSNEKEVAGLQAKVEELDRECNELHAKNGDLQLEIAELKDKLQHDSVSQSIDAAALLNLLTPLLGRGHKLSLKKLEEIVSQVSEG